MSGPLLEPREAVFGVLGDGKTAVIEMAAASGLPFVPREKRDPFRTTSAGTGQLIAAALDEGCDHVIMGIGGSATNDGGAGMLQACLLYTSTILRPIRLRGARRAQRRSFCKSWTKTPCCPE